jgi:phosphopantothenoylcysteine decarboxylase/phosphopantothenate--cysteine ligase
MSRLSNRRILLGITGGIAAYKACEIVRRLKDANADVRVVMTEGAQAFITPLTLQALSGNPVHTDLLDTDAEAAMGHIELAKWADAILIAPASADFIAKLNAGLASDLLSTLCLASTAKKAIAPAMNQAMYNDLATHKNIEGLKDKGFIIFGPAQGAQACGDVGPGRMLEANEISDLLAAGFETRLLDGKHIVITAGPTREAIDPVRYISNHSSGKMGYALAQAAIDAGAMVTLISGPVNIAAPERVKLVNVVSADEMLSASLTAAESADIFIASAAVADYKVAEVATQKIKKSGERISLELIKNPDIIATITKNHPGIFAVGFAAETEKLKQHANEKLQRKNLKLIIANDVSNSDIGFNSDNNAVTIFTNNEETVLGIQSKTRLAQELIQHIAHNYKKLAGADNNGERKKAED